MSILALNRFSTDIVAASQLSAVRLCCGVTVGLCSNSTALLSRLLQLLPGSSGSESAHVDVTFSLHEHRNLDTARSYEFLVNQRCVHVYQPSMECLSSIQAYMQEAVAILSRDSVFVHAGVVSWKGRTIVLPGKSGSGKTTLVMALVEAGATYYSDEYAVIDAKGHVSPYLREPHVKNASAQHRVDLFLRNGLGASSGVLEPEPVGLILMTAYSAGANWQPRRLSSGECFFGLLANGIAVRYRPEICLKVLNRLCSSAKAFASDRGEADALAQTILGLMG